MRLPRSRGDWLLVGLLIVSAVQLTRAQRPTESAAGAAGVVEGVVSTDNGQNARIPLGGAVVSVSRGSTESGRQLSDGEGTFRFDNLPPGDYTLTAFIQGFDPTTVSVTVAAAQVTRIVVDLRLTLAADRVDVVAQDLPISGGTLGRREQITGGELEQLAPGGGFQAALRLLSSVIQVPGGMSIKGGRPSQASVQLGPGIFVDPATGLTQGALPDDAIDSVTVLPNPYAVEFGRFSSGLVVIETRRGADRWRTRVNSLEPAFRTERHEPFHIIGVQSFSPRFETGGPLISDRLFIKHADQYRYYANDIPSRPQSEVQTSNRFSSFTRLDANLSKKHSLVGVAGLFPSQSSLATLGTFTPPDATVDLKGNVQTGAVTERTMWSDTLLSETTLQVNEYRAEVLPQGRSPMEQLPETTLGNFYNRQNRTTSSYQIVETFSGSAKDGIGLHLYKVGFDVMHNGFSGQSVSSSFSILRPDGTLARRLDFGSAALLQAQTTDLAVFAQDRWQPRSRFYLEFGGRLDRDGITDRFNLTPRLGAAVLLNASGSSVVRSGYGLFYERTPSVAGVFDQYEHQIETRYASDGVTPLGPPVAFVHVTAPDLRTSQSTAWDVSFDHRFSPRWSLHAAAVARRGEHELLVQPVTAGPASELRLQSTGRSEYREAEIGMHVSPSRNADLHVTYARSVARADLNAYTAFFDTIMAPVLGPNAFAPARTDVPNRILARGRLSPLPRWQLVGVVDWRTGLPYSLTDEALDFVGARNGQRFPTYFRVDVGVEHRFKLGRLEPWIGFRADNALNSWLPVDVQANISSAAFGTFYNSEYRQFRIQVRFER